MTGTIESTTGGFKVDGAPKVRALSTIRAVFSVLGVDQSVASRTSFGGTAPDNVRRAIQDARERFK